MNRSDFVTFAGASVIAGCATGCSRPSMPDSKLVDVPSFARARERIDESIRADSINPLVSIAGHPRFYHRGKRTERAALLLHGFTNCPQQFDEFARSLYDRGANVYVPRIPHHGMRDRMTHDLHYLTVAELIDFANDACALARALGERVTVLGLSLGGTLAAWLAQTQAVDHAIPIAPFLAPAGFGRMRAGALTSVASAIPDVYWWWDVRKLERTTPKYAYPGYPIHALANIMRLGSDIFELAAVEKPRAKRCTLVTNVDDNGIDNAVAAELLGRWHDRGAPYTGYAFRDLGMPRHDIIDPTTFPAARSLVYPELATLAFA